MKLLDRTFMETLRAQLEVLGIDELKQEIAERMAGRKVTAPKIPAGTFVYRARRVEAFFHPAQGVRPRDLSYPPIDFCREGRLNRASAPLFYASTSKSPLLFELGASPGEEYVFSIWQIKSSPILSSLGYTNSVFASLGAQREAPRWLQIRQRSTRRDDDDVLSELFAERVQLGETVKYKLTQAIAELHYESLEGGAQRFAGVLYPSVAMWANGDNIALRPWFVDDHLEWKKAIHIRVDACDEKYFSISEIDAARHLDSDGKLVWTGHAGVKLIGPGPFTFLFTTGRDEWGDYLLGKDNVVGHWVGIEQTTGRRFSV